MVRARNGRGLGRERERERISFIQKQELHQETQRGGNDDLGTSILL